MWIRFVLVLDPLPQNPVSKDEDESDDEDDSPRRSSLVVYPFCGSTARLTAISRKAAPASRRVALCTRRKPALRDEVSDEIRGLARKSRVRIISSA
jgi:hypothetical protein